MPIGNITQDVSTIPAPPHRGVDTQSVFVNKQEDFQDHLADITIGELNTLKGQLNTRIGEINSTTTTMQGYASTASAGASTATTKAGEASTSASEASTSRNQAETFKNNASTSATRASQWADNNYNAAVEAGKYSAKHWATVAQNATSGKMDKVTSTDNAIVRFNGTTGDVQNSGVIIDDNGTITTQGLRSTSPIYGIGYGTGSGGTVTQLTNKNYNVSLNKPTGIIITSNSALASGQIAWFTFLNSLLDINDNLKLTPKGTIGYNIDVIDIYNGAATVRIVNRDSISRSDAISINFSIIKGANS